MANSAANAANKPADAPHPKCAGSPNSPAARNAIMTDKFTLTGINAAIAGNLGRSNAKKLRDIRSSKLHPTILGANPKNTPETSRVDSAVKLPRSNNNAIASVRNAIPARHDNTAPTTIQATDLSINRYAFGACPIPRKRAISGNKEFEIGYTKYAISTLTHFMV